MIFGAFLGLFIAGYTGVLISVSNQPIWSDTWTLGGVFLASGLSVSAATLALLARGRSDAASAHGKLSRADTYFIVLELILLVAFFATLGALASRLLAPRWLALWALVVVRSMAFEAITRPVHLDAGRCALTLGVATAAVGRARHSSVRQVARTLASECMARRAVRLGAGTEARMRLQRCVLDSCFFLVA